MPKGVYARSSEVLTRLKGQGFKTGVPSWNKGTKGLMPSWNKGLTSETDIRVAKIAIARVGQLRPSMTGEKHHRYWLGKKAENNTHWKGGRIAHGDGYIWIYSPEHPNRVLHGKSLSGYVLEHRLVMEKQIGRYLLRTETVHHINGIKDDNRPENLELFENQSEHVKHHHSLGSFASCL